MHAYSTYIPSSCCLWLAAKSMHDIQGPSFVNCALTCIEVCVLSTKQADLKSTIQQNKPLREARLGCVFEQVEHCLGAPIH